MSCIWLLASKRSVWEKDPMFLLVPQWTSIGAVWTQMVKMAVVCTCIHAYLGKHNHPLSFLFSKFTALLTAMWGPSFCPRFNLSTFCCLLSSTGLHCVTPHNPGCETGQHTVHTAQFIVRWLSFFYSYDKTGPHVKKEQNNSKFQCSFFCPIGQKINDKMEEDLSALDRSFFTTAKHPSQSSTHLLLHAMKEMVWRDSDFFSKAIDWADFTQGCLFYYLIWSYWWIMLKMLCGRRTCLFILLLLHSCLFDICWDNHMETCWVLRLCLCD